MPRALARIESVAYCISKTALDGVTVQLAALPRFAINSVYPGWVRTDMDGSNATCSVAQGASGIVWLAADAIADAIRGYLDLYGEPETRCKICEMEVVTA